MQDELTVLFGEKYIFLINIFLSKITGFAVAFLKNYIPIL